MSHHYFLVDEVESMPRQFSLATVFRMVPNDLLKDFFARLENPCFSMDWRRRPRLHVDSVMQCLDYFSSTEREAAELILRNVFELAGPSGCQAIRDAARLFQLLPEIPDFLAPYALAMWTWLNQTRVFEQALLFHEVQKLSWWQRRDDMPQVDPLTDADALERLGTDVSRLLTKEQGRGRRCTVEHACRDEETDYFLCFPDGYPRMVTQHNSAGKLVAKRLRQTFEIIFAYRREQGTLETHSRLPGRLKQELEETFAWAILEENIGPNLPRQVYDLSPLKQSHFQLQTDPTDQVHVELRKIRLDLPDNTRRITLESKTGPADEMGRMVEECLNEEEISLDEVKVSLARMRFAFAATTGRAKGTMTFDVASPNTCNLRTHRPERVAIAQKYLRKWRIADV